jgi:hypothetical protein
MRHDLVPLAVGPSPPRMRKASGAAALIAPSRAALGLAARSVRTFVAAIALAAVAAPAHQHLRAAAATGKRAGAVLHLTRLQHNHRAARDKCEHGAAQDNAGTAAPATDAILRTHSRSTHEWGAAAPRCSTRRVAAPAFSTGHRCTALEPRSDVPAQLRPDATTAPQGASNLSTKLPRSRQPAAAIFACRRRPHVSQCCRPEAARHHCLRLPTPVGPFL